MKIPFTVTQFLSVFESYNLAIWPMQIFAYLLGIAAVYMAVKKTAPSGKIISGVLSFTWVWVGAVYHITYFTAINKAAYLFGVLFIIQGVFFLYCGVLKQSIIFGQGPGRYRYVGLLLIVYAMLVYPALGYVLGHGYPQSPVFGVTPCPVTIFTFGLLILAEKLPRPLVVIPLIWSFIGFGAALTMGILEDTGLLVAGIAGTTVIIIKQGIHRASFQSPVPKM